MFEEAIFHWIELIHSLFKLYHHVVLLRFSSHASLFLIGSNAINAATITYDKQRGKQSLYWLHSLLLVIMTGFGGGFVGPMLIGKPSLPIANDLVIPMCIIAWYATHYLPGVQNALTWAPIKCIWVVFLGLFRTTAVCSIVKTAALTLEAGPYYPIALVGPIIAGTVLGAGGQFFPADKGLTAVTNGTPWPVQGAFMTASFYHLMVNDTKGFLGNFLRSILGTYSDDSARVTIATIHIVTLLAQTIFHSESNFFTPVHKFLYLIFQVEGPSGVSQKDGTVGWDYRTRILLTRWLELSRVLTVIFVFFVHVYSSLPPPSLLAGQKLEIGEKGNIGRCQMLGSLRPCTPYTFSASPSKIGANGVVETFQLTSYKGFSGAVKGVTDQVWNLTITPKKKNAPSPSIETFLSIGEDGIVRLISSNTIDKNEEILWSSKSQCVGGGSEKVAMSLDITSGKPIIQCANGKIVDLA